MQRNSQLAALLVAFCSEPTLAGGGAAGNSTRAANYTALAAQLSALRLANSSNSSANGSGQGHLGVRHSPSSGQLCGRLGQQRHSKKTANVVHGKKGSPSKKNTRQPALQPPSHQRHNSSIPHPQTQHNSSSSGGRSLKVKQSLFAPASSNTTGSHSESDDGTITHSQALYRQNHRGYVLETRRQRKRRMAQEGDSSTPLYAGNFTNMRCNHKGRYHLAENIDVSQTGAILPLCKNQTFQGALKGDGHTLRINSSRPLFDNLSGATIDVRLEDSTYNVHYTPEAGALARALEGYNNITLTGGRLNMHNAAGLISSFGQINEGGPHRLNQINFRATLSGNRVGGGIGTVSTNATVIQTDCEFNVTNLRDGGIGAFMVMGGSLVLTQTNVTIRETERLQDAFTMAGGVRTIYRGSAVITQTGVSVRLLPPRRECEGAAFVSAVDDQTNVTLRLFSGSGTSGDSTINVCGIIFVSGVPVPGVQGVIDTAGYAANPDSCQQDNPTGLQLLDTTQAADWRTAHKEFCCSEVEGIPPISCPWDNPHVSCHYPHEQLLATVPMGEHSALLLTRQGYPYNATSAERGLLRVSCLQLKSLKSGHRAAELNRSFGSNGTLLFAPGSYHQQLQPRHVVLALSCDQKLTLLCRSGDSNRPAYHLATLPLQGATSDNATVEMQALAELRGEPVTLTFAQEPFPQIWTHEKNNESGDLFYFYEQPANATAPVQRYNLTQSNGGTVIGTGTHNHTLYVVSCNQTDVVIQYVDPVTRSISEPTPVALLELSPSESPDDTLTIDGGTLLLIPPNTIFTQEDTDQPQRVWQVKLPAYGGQASWQVSEEQAVRLDEKNCERLSAPEDASSREPFEDWFISSTMAAYGLCCTAAVAGIICKKCWHHGRNHTGDQTAPLLVETQTTNDDAMELQEKSGTAAWQSDWELRP